MSKGPVVLRFIFCCLVAQALLGIQDLGAQGTIYFSNLAAPPTGSAAIGSDSWIAQSFFTGTNSQGYLLNSVRVLMTPASGGPTGFTLSIYTRNAPGQFPAPAIPVAALTGLDPVAGGIFSYSASGVTLSPGTIYFLVGTATTPVAAGAFNWSATRSEPAPGQDLWTSGLFYYDSADGLDWQISRQHLFQFEVNASLIPEPSSLALLICGAVLLAGHWLRRFRKRE